MSILSFPVKLRREGACIEGRQQLLRDRFHFSRFHLVINEANQAMRSLCIISLVKVETTKFKKNPDFFCCFLLFFVLN